MPNKFQPALLGGAFIGVLSALPFVSAGNACCCLWVILGGVITAYLMQQNHAEPITLGDGAVGGFVAGLIGAVIYVVVAIPFSFLLGPMQRQMMDAMMANNPDFPPAMRDWITSMSGGMLSIVLSFTFMLVAGVIFGTLGGVIGAAIFKKNPPPPGTVEVLPPS
jgi:hypothetical protein